MKKLLLVLSCTFLIAACDCGKEKKDAKHAAFTPPVEKQCSELHPPMSNEDIIKETKYCESNGLDAVAYSCGGNSEPTKIVCSPRSKE